MYACSEVPLSVGVESGPVGSGVLLTGSRRTWRRVEGNRRS
jgi:hypothetical protein